MLLESYWGAFKAQLKRFARARRGNVAMIFALSLIPITIAAGAGLDLSRALMVRARLAEALDAAGLAVGATQNLSADQIKVLANAYFAANYTADSSFGPMPTVDVTQGNGSVTLTTSIQMPTTLMRVAKIDSLTVGYSSKVVWGQTKLWVSLVLDNTGSMCEPDSQPCPSDTSTDIKINALKSASHSLLTTLQNASANPGDVMVSIVPFAKDVNVGTSNVNAGWIDWTDWETAAPSGDKPGSSVGPGSNCPWNNSTYNKCLDQPGGTMGSNGVTMNTVSTIPSTGSNAGYICPGSIRSSNNGQAGHYYNGCWTSTPNKTLSTKKTTTQPIKDKQTCTQTGSGAVNCVEQNGYPQNNGSSSTSTSSSTSSGYSGDSVVNSSTTTNVNTSDGSKSCSGSGSRQKCTWTRTITENQNSIVTTNTAATGSYDHTWVVNSHSTWRGCVMDRDQNDDANDTTPGTKFPAENSDSCPVASVFPMTNPVPNSTLSMSAMFTSLSSEIDSMVANGGTNQTIGLAHGMQTLVGDLPYSAPTLPANTSRYIILLSDGLNTMDRWYGNGSAQSSSVNDRMSAACTNAKNQGFVIYTIFLDLNGTQGSSDTLQSCATDTSKYFDLTTTGSVITTFNNIAQQITQLRVAQ